MHIREVQSDDSARLIALLRTIYAETHFMLFEADEFTLTNEQQARRIEEIARTESGAMFVCETQDGLIGAIFGNRGFARRTRHSL
jgi:hypothetical protein